MARGSLRSMLLAAAASALAAGCGGGGGSPPGVVAPPVDPGTGADPGTGTIPGACSDDAYEPDDTAAAARPLPLGVEIRRNFCADGQDWGSFQAVAGERLGLRLVSDLATAAITIVSGDAQSFLGSLSTEAAGVPVSGAFTAPATGTYLVLAHPGTYGQTGPGLGYGLSLLPARSDPQAWDLYVESFYWPPVGGVVDVRVDLVNHAFAMAEPVTIEFALSADGVLDAGDRRIDRQLFPALGEDDWQYRSFLVPIPPDVAPGEWNLLFVVDPDDVLPELVETNNVSPPAPLTLVAPECPVDGFEHDDRPADARPIVLGAPQARNFCEDGHDWVRFDAAAGDAFTIEAEPSMRPQFISFQVLAPSGAVVAQAEDSYGLVLTFAATETGVYRVEAGTDLWGDFEEYVLSVTRAEPDLTATALTFGALVPGGVVTVRADYENLAATPSGPFSIGLYLSRDEVLDPSDVALGAAAISGVGGHERWAGPEVGVSLPPDVGTGDWWLLAMADPGARVPELDETNNVGAGWTVTVGAAACASDAYEPDDFPSQARALPLGVAQLRNHCDDRRDWAAVSVTAGDPLAVRLDQSSFSGFDVRLYAADGTTLLASAWDAVFWRADRTGTVLVCAGCEDAPGVRAPASYRLTAALCAPDANEPDDTVATARTLPGTRSASLNGCDGTKDYLRFDAAAGSRYGLTVSASSAAAAPRATFVDASGYPLPTTRGELTATASGPVWIELDPPMSPTLIDSGYTVTLSAR